MRTTMTLSRERSGGLVLKPDAVEIQVYGPGQGASMAGGHYRLKTPMGWTAAPTGPLRWSVRPLLVDPDRMARFVVTTVSGAPVGTEAQVEVDLDLRGSFEPARHALSARNRATEIGQVDPRMDVFEQTFLPMPKPLRRLLFEGIYSDIVFLRSEGRRGGLCSGMARWALARAGGEEPPPVSLSEAIERVQIFHGRQMTDRALLSALPWFLRGSSRAAFRAVRRDLLRNGATDRALDLAVPKLWRRDLAKALVGEGHTVVPIRLRQRGPDRGAIDVYDPNHPGMVGIDEQRTIEFDLKRDRYAFGRLVASEQTNVGMIAVRQRAYRAKGSAVLALLGSLLFAPRRGFRSLLGRNRNARA